MMMMANILHVNHRPFDGAVFRSLELHADFACENCGLCCQRSWDIQITGDEQQRLREKLLAAGRAAEDIDQGIIASPVAHDPNRALLGCKVSGHCRFLGDEEFCSYCTVQRQAGHEALPAICQSYPRVAVATPAGVYLTLTYTCPAAAKLLLHETGLAEAAPRGTVQYQPRMIGASFTGNVQPPKFSAKCQPTWVAFDYFWRWTPEWMADQIMTPAEALYGLGEVVSLVEQMGERAGDLMQLMELLDQAGRTLPAVIRKQARTLTAPTELGVIYLDTILNIANQTLSEDNDFQKLWSEARNKLDLSREGLLAAYRTELRPRLAEFANIERNYLASRLFANPVTYRVDRLRTGYFFIMLSFIALRFSVLALSKLEQRPIDTRTWLKGAGMVDYLMQHNIHSERRFLDLLEKNMDGPIHNFSIPALI